MKGANPALKITGVDELAARATILLAATRSSGIPTFQLSRACNCGTFIPAIDLVYRGKQGRLEYDLEAAPMPIPRVSSWKSRARANSPSTPRTTS